jgi:hypothetical protein
MDFPAIFSSVVPGVVSAAKVKVELVHVSVLGVV